MKSSPLSLTSYRALLVLFPIALLAAGCGGGAAKPQPGGGCVLNSDCTSPLVCTFAVCHAGCKVQSDCPSDQLCVQPSVGSDGGSSAGAGTANVCQLPKETICVYNSDCTLPLVCARDEQCHNQCKTVVDCVAGQVCTTSGVCATQGQLVAGTNDVPIVTKGLDAGTGGARGGASGGGAGGGAAGAGGTAGTAGTGGSHTCPPNPQTAFGNIAQGDANPYFNSGVGVRNANKLFIFSGYTGPEATDAGVDAAASTPGNYIYVQTFDPATGNSLGHADRLLFEGAATSTNLAVYDVSIAPTGEIALLHYLYPTGGYATQLLADFFSATPGDAGAAPLTLVKTVQLESVPFGEPHVVWSVASQAFVISWKYDTVDWYTRVRRFQPTGQPAGSDTNIVPTNTGNDAPSTWDDGRVGTSGQLLGVSYVESGPAFPFLTILDRDGLQVGGFVQLNQTLPVSGWASVGGTADGFLGLFNSNSATVVNGTFVPTSGTGSVLADAGAPDAGDGGTRPPLKSFSFRSNATGCQMISDDTGGAGGVGAVLLESNGASFLYVTADGSKQFELGTQISSSTGAMPVLSNYHGSFALSLYDKTTHATQVVASGCGL